MDSNNKRVLLCQNDGSGCANHFALTGFQNAGRDIEEDANGDFILCDPSACAKDFYKEHGIKFRLRQVSKYKTKVTQRLNRAVEEHSTARKEKKESFKVVSMVSTEGPDPEDIVDFVAEESDCAEDDLAMEDCSDEEDEDETGDHLAPVPATPASPKAQQRGKRKKRKKRKRTPISMLGDRAKRGRTREFFQDVLGSTPETLEDDLREHMKAVVRILKKSAGSTDLSSEYTNLAAKISLKRRVSAETVVGIVEDFARGRPYATEEERDLETSLVPKVWRAYKKQREALEAQSLENRVIQFWSGKKYLICWKLKSAMLALLKSSNVFAKFHLLHSQQRAHLELKWTWSISTQNQFSSPEARLRSLIITLPIDLLLI